MKWTLSTLYKDRIIKFYKELENPFLEKYCLESEKVERETQYHYGYNSLKWYIYSLRGNMENEILWDTFYKLMLEYKALNKTENDIQYKILSFPSTYKYKEELKKQVQIPDPNDLPTVQIGSWQAILNETQHNITNQIFKKTRADVIIFQNPVDKSTGVVFRVNSKMNSLVDEKTKLLIELFKPENGSGWVALNDGNLMINHGTKKEGAYTSLTVEDIIDIMKEIFI